MFNVTTTCSLDLVLGQLVMICDHMCFSVEAVKGLRLCSFIYYPVIDSNIIDFLSKERSDPQYQPFLTHYLLNILPNVSYEYFSFLFHLSYDSGI